MGEHAAVEFERGQERGFDMAMGVDEARDDDLAADVDLARAAIVAHRSDDPVAADRDVAFDEFAADEIEDPPALEHEIGFREALPLLDGATKKGDGVAHGVPSGGSAKIPRPLSQAWPSRSMGCGTSGPCGARIRRPGAAPSRRRARSSLHDLNRPQVLSATGRRQKPSVGRIAQGFTPPPNRGLSRRPCLSPSSRSSRMSSMATSAIRRLCSPCSGSGARSGR